MMRPLALAVAALALSAVEGRAACNDYLVYDSEAAALADEATFTARGRALFQADGYTLDAQQNVIGKRNGVPDPTAQPTTRWDVPRQRAGDAKWVLSDPACLPIAGEVLPATSPLTIGQAVKAGITAPVEPYDPAWFPAPSY